MTNLLAFVAPLALLLPIAGIDGEVAPERYLGTHAAQLDPDQAEKIANGKVSKSAKPLAPVAFENPVQRQVRIKQQVIVRITPRSSRARSNLVADLPRRAPTSKVIERKIGKCIPLKSIAGVQTGNGNELILYLRDQRVVKAKLEKSCRARDYYSGFYVEKDKDGKLCIDRDELQSRSGAKCEVKKLRQLVAVSQ